MTNVPDMVIAGVVAAVGAFVVAASFSRNFNRRRRKHRPVGTAPPAAVLFPLTVETEAGQIITPRREKSRMLPVKVADDVSSQNGAALVFYDMLAAYSSV